MNQFQELLYHLVDRLSLQSLYYKQIQFSQIPNIFSIISYSEAARRIAASGIPILSRTQTEPSISRQLSVRRIIPSLEPVPSRTIRPPRLPPAPPRIPIRQLPRIQRRVDAPPRPRPVQQQQQPAPPQQHLNRTSSTTSSFLDNLLNTQQRLHNLQNVRIQG